MGKRYALIILLISALSSLSTFADTYVRQPSVDVIHYDISIQLSDSSNAIAGIAKIQALIRGESATGMWLDLADMSVSKVLVGGMTRSFKCNEGRLSFEFDHAYIRNDMVDIEVRYRGKPGDGLLFGKNKYGRRVVFAENWPDKAHHWFPSIDHPSDKASVSFTVTAPDKYEVIANGLLKKTALLPSNRKMTQWAETKSIPTYCMVVGIGEFSLLRSTKDTLPLTWYVYPQDSQAASVKFRRTDQMISYFEKLLGPYPYDKLAQVESTIRLGAMENSNTIFYGEDLFGSLSEEPVAHELAHQWFGDSITESDWDQLWLSEGFATYLEALFYEHVNGPEAMTRAMERHTTRILSYRQSMDRPIIDPLQTDLMKKLSPLTYEKGAWVLHMLRGMLGDKAFFAGLHQFYVQYAGGNISTADFQKAMELAGGLDLKHFFQQWLYEPGLPEYRISWQWDQSAGNLDVFVQQTQLRGLFDMPVEIRVAAGNRSETHRFRVHQAAHVFRLPFTAKPTAVELDPGNHILKVLVP